MLKYFGGLISFLVIGAVADEAAKSNELNEVEQETMQALRKYWPHHNKQMDLYPDLTDTKKKLIYMHHEDYDTEVVSNTTAQFVSDRPWFISFVRPGNPESFMMSESLQDLAYYYQGEVQFAYTALDLEERLAFTFDIFDAPRSYFIDTDGMAYLFDPVFPSINGTIDWIDNKIYKKNPHSFKAPSRWPEWKLKYWGYIKNNVRQYYMKNYRDKVEGFIRKNLPFFTWGCDMEPLNFREAKPMLRTNRQIILFFSFVTFVLEYVYDFVYEMVNTSTPAEKAAARPQTLMSGRKKKKTEESVGDNKDAAAADKSKERREKID